MGFSLYKGKLGVAFVDALIEQTAYTVIATMHAEDS